MVRNHIKQNRSSVNGMAPLGTIIINGFCSMVQQPYTHVDSNYPVEQSGNDM